jgi:hypothetical protein
VHHYFCSCRSQLEKEILKLKRELREEKRKRELADDKVADLEEKARFAEERAVQAEDRAKAMAAEIKARGPSSSGPVITHSILQALQKEIQELRNKKASDSEVRRRSPICFAARPALSRASREGSRSLRTVRSVRKVRPCSSLPDDWLTRMRSSLHVRTPWAGSVQVLHVPMDGRAGKRKRSRLRFRGRGSSYFFIFLFFFPPKSRGMLLITFSRSTPPATQRSRPCWRRAAATSPCRPQRSF